MSKSPSPPPYYEPKILPALRRIQEQYGYLKAEELRRFSKSSEIPLYRLQEVASFFPHFRLTEAPAVTVKVCRDVACHMKGSAALTRELSEHCASFGEGKVRVEGVSCLGRCDRPVAVAISASANRGPHEEFYSLGRNAGELKQIVGACLNGTPMAADADRDAGRGYPSADWLIDPYHGGDRDYRAVRKVVDLRDDALRRAAEALRTSLKQPGVKAGEVVEAVRGLVEAGDAARGSDADAWVEAVLGELDTAHSNLRGMGGAGIPATLKWRDVRNAVAVARRRGADRRAFVVVNGDESEPATFKDRELLLHCPHLVIEAVIIAGLITDATQGFIYIRHEFAEQIAACRAEIKRAEEQGVCGMDARILSRPFPVSVFVSPGGYICGEQSALIEAMSDRRGEPRNLPPGLETNGLDDRPTLLSNVETYAWVPHIVLNGGKKYAELGVNRRKGRRFFSVCGDVNRPGVYEVPMGMTLRELICGARYCQGIAGGRKLKALAPSGPSGGFLPARIPMPAIAPHDKRTRDEWEGLVARRGIDTAAKDFDILDMELELDLFRAVSPTHALGAGLVVYHDGRNMAEQAVNSLEFFRNESCGKCVPCRVGSQKIANLGGNLLAGRIDATEWNESLLPLVKELCEVIGLSSICGLGRSIPMPIGTLIDFFTDDLRHYLVRAEQPLAVAAGV